jgi:hypothetical protein
MNAEDIAKAAWEGTELQQFATLEDLHLHTCLLRVYADFRAGRMDKATAEGLKKRMVAAWADDKKTRETWEKMNAERAAAIMAVQTLNPEKATTAAECIGILAQTVAALTGDSSLPARMKEKWG